MGLKKTLDDIVNSVKLRVGLAVLTAAASLGMTERANAVVDTSAVGYIYNGNILLPAAGTDPAGGNDPNANYFPTSSGVVVTDKDGIQVKTIPLPGSCYGAACDENGKLYLSNTSGSSIYGYVSDTMGWDERGISETNAKGLAILPEYFALLVKNGLELVLIRKDNGVTEHRIVLPSYLNNASGLDYIPDTNEILLTRNTGYFYRIKLTPDMNGIESYKTTKATGRLGVTLRGIGFNTSTDTIIFNDNYNRGEYAIGPDVNVTIDSTFEDPNDLTHPEYTNVEYIVTNNSNDNNKATYMQIPSAGVLQTSLDPINQANWNINYDGNNIVVTPYVSGNGLAPGETMTVYAQSQYPTIANANATVTTTAAPVNVNIPTLVIKTLLGDLTDDGKVDAADLSVMAGDWLSREPGTRADINHDGIVNLHDFQFLACQWLMQETWYPAP